MTEHWFSKPTQRYWTCHALTHGRTITHRHEMAERRAWRLSAIIHTLRSEYHWPIETEFRGPERVAHYRLSEGCDVLELSYPRSARGVLTQLRKERGCDGGNGGGNG